MAEVSDLVGPLSAMGVYPRNEKIEGIDGLREELDSKLDASALSANKLWFMTDKASGVEDYLKLVDDTHDDDFPAVTVEVETDTIGGTETLIGAFVTPAFDKYAHNDNLPITITGACKRSSGNANAIVSFKVYLRDGSGNETLVAESSGASVTLDDYAEINDTCFIPHIEVEVGERIAVKYFAKKSGLGSGLKLKYRVGGAVPMRVLVPLPVTAMLPDLDISELPDTYQKREEWDGKQDELSAGDNIEIDPTTKVISATDTTYDAGAGLKKTGTTFTPDFGLGSGKVVEGDTLATPSSDGLMSKEDKSLITRLLSLDHAEIVWDQSDDTYVTDNMRVTSVHLNMRRCLLRDGVVNYYLDANDSTLKEKGGVADLSGADGDVMVAIPPCYTRWSWNGDKLTVGVSPVPREGYTLDTAFNGEFKPIYVGAYQAVAYSVSDGDYIDGLNLDDATSRVTLGDDTLNSVAGHYAMVGLNIEELRQMAMNKGDGYGIFDYHTFCLLLKLYLSEYGSWNSQTKIGSGNVNRSYVESSSNQGDSPHTINGVSNHLGNSSGAETSPDPFACYRGIEHMWGNVGILTDGINFNNREAFICPADTELYDSDKWDSPYHSIGSMPNETNTYTKKIHNIDQYLPAEGGGSSASYIPDRFVTDTVKRALYLFGHSSYGVSAGFAFFHANSFRSYRSRTRGSRLLYREKRTAS